MTVRWTAYASLAHVANLVPNPHTNRTPIPVCKDAVASAEITPTGTSTPSAVMHADAKYLVISTDADAWIAVGPSPDATASPRRFLRADAEIEIGVDGGTDKIDAVTAA